MQEKNVTKIKEKSERTRSIILKTAQRLFAQKGFSGTSMGSIAKEAKVTHSLLFHHFDDKKNLWNKVKRQIVKEHGKLKEMIPETKLPFSEFVKQLIGLYIQFYKDNPDIQRIIAWQRLEEVPQSNLKAGKSLEYTKLVSSIEIYQNKDCIGSNFNPHYIINLILSVCSGIIFDKNILFSDEEDLNKYIDFCINNLLATVKH